MRSPAIPCTKSRCGDQGTRGHRHDKAKGQRHDTCGRRCWRRAKPMELNTDTANGGPPIIRRADRVIETFEDQAVIAIETCGCRGPRSQHTLGDRPRNRLHRMGHCTASIATRSINRSLRSVAKPMPPLRGLAPAPDLGDGTAALGAVSSGMAIERRSHRTDSRPH